MPHDDSAPMGPNPGNYDPFDPTKPMGPVVYVTQWDPRLSFKEAESFGEVRFLTKKEYRPLPIPMSFNTVVVHDIATGLEHYRPGMDYILLTGSSMATVLTSVIIGRMPGTHLILKWNNRIRGYDTYELGVPPLE